MTVISEISNFNILAGNTAGRSPCNHTCLQPYWQLCWRSLLLLITDSSVNQDCQAAVASIPIALVNASYDACSSSSSIAAASLAANAQGSGFPTHAHPLLLLLPLPDQDCYQQQRAPQQPHAESTAPAARATVHRMFSRAGAALPQMVL